MPARLAVRFKTSARKEFDKLPARIQDRTLEAIEVLRGNPRTDLLQTKKLRGSENLYRLRLGDYRIVYEIHGQELVIVVVKIGHRSQVYRRL